MYINAYVFETSSLYFLFTVVETNCNDGASFLCDDIKCIANGQICDGVTDCENGQDEMGCIVPETCQEWWNAGYKTSGTYKVCE